MILLIVSLTTSTLSIVAYIAGNQFRTVLLDSTLVVCRNLSFDVSDVAREELLINSIYANTRQVIKGFQQRNVTGLENAFVVYRTGEIVAHSNSQLTGTRLSPKKITLYSKFKKIQQLDTQDSLIFVDPITINYQNRDFFLGFSVFEFNRKKIFGPIDSFLWDFWIISIVFIVLGFFAAVVFASRMSRPIEILARAAESIGRGKLGAQVKITKSDEIGKLADTFNQMSSQLADSQKQKIIEATIHKEMEIAKDIQMSMLPANDIMGPWEFRGFMKTADDVGGDYYDCIEVVNNREKNWWFLIGDVSGHGLTAGLTMLMAQTSVSTALAMKPAIGSREFFTIVNAVLYQNIRKLRQQRYMTATFLRSDSKGNIQYSGLHLDLLVYRKKKNTVELFETDGLWLGIEPDVKPFTTIRKLKLNKGDVLFLFTDGMVEAMNSSQNMFSQERLVKVIQNHSLGPLDKLESKILNELEKFCQTTSYEDDITFTMIRKL